MLFAALGCNLASGIIDAGVFLMVRFNEQGRNIMRLRAVRKAADIGIARGIVAEATDDGGRRAEVERAAVCILADAASWVAVERVFRCLCHGTSDAWAGLWAAPPATGRRGRSRFLALNS